MTITSKFDKMKYRLPEFPADQLSASAIVHSFPSQQQRETEKAVASFITALLTFMDSTKTDNKTVSFIFLLVEKTVSNSIGGQ